MALNRVTTIAKGFRDWHVTSMADFNDWVKEVSGTTKVTIFRGQRRRWPLLPSIGRQGSGRAIIDREKRAFERFRAEAPSTLQEVPSSDWDWLVVAQHHQLPTRLLDWTDDPFIALWFALREARSDSDRPEVWVMSPTAGDVIEDLARSLPFAGSRTKVFESRFNHPRIRAQRSWFTATKFVDTAGMGFIPIEKNRDLRDRVQRVRIASYSALKILAELEERGYKESRIFPSTDEVACRIWSQVS